MNRTWKLITRPLSLLATAFLFAVPCVRSQQAEPAQPTGNDANSGIYSPSVNRLSSPSILGPLGSYGGAFTVTKQQSGAGELNAAGLKSGKPEAQSLLRSGWSGGANSFSAHGTTVWTAGAKAFSSTGSTWVAGATNFGMPVQTGGVWRSAALSGFSSASSSGIARAAALTTGAIPSASVLGAGSTHGGMGSGLRSGISDPLGELHSALGTSGQSNSISHGSGATGNQIGTPQLTGGLSDPFSPSSSNSGGQLGGGSGSNGPQ